MTDTGNLIFAKAVLFADPDGDNIEFAEIQDVSIEFRDTTVKARGKSLYPLAIALAERDATIRGSNLKIWAPALQLLIGGSVTYADNKTTISLTEDSEPSTFKMLLQSPSGGADGEVLLYKVRPMNFTLGLPLKEFAKPSYEFEVMVDDDGNVCDIILPGYQSVT